MRKVDRSSVPQPASFASEAARAERDQAEHVAPLKQARLMAYKEALDAYAKSGGPKPKKPPMSKEEADFEFKAYKAEDIREALEQLFHGKCAYCETRYAHQAPVDIEHYRPKSAVEGAVDHPGYWWLAAEWDNLLPSCIDCNRRRTQILRYPFGSGMDYAAMTEVDFVSLSAVKDLPEASALAGKQDAFPIAGRKRWRTAQDAAGDEYPYLLDPTSDDPDAYLDYYLDHEWDGIEPLGIILPRKVVSDGPYAPPGLPSGQSGPSLRGLLTIQCFGLNRLHLVQERTAVLRRLEFLRALLGRTDGAVQELQAVRRGLSGDAGARLDRVANVLEGVIDDIIAEIEATAKPDQPYSALARCWIRKWRQSLPVPPS